MEWPAIRIQVSGTPEAHAGLLAREKSSAPNRAVLPSGKDGLGE